MELVNLRLFCKGMGGQKTIAGVLLQSVEQLRVRKLEVWSSSNSVLRKADSVRRWMF